MVNKIMSRYYITADIILASPLSLSGGMEENTDSDVMRDGEGRLLISGSSVAGAFRRYLGQKKDDKGIFGYLGKEEKEEEKKENGYMSSLFFSDIYFEEDHNSIVSERDGVSLSDEKTVNNKFDYEIIETGAKAHMRIEKIYREQDEKKGFQDGVEEIRELLSALNKGEIRFGAKKNRGCGWIKVEKVYKHEFKISKETVKERDRSEKEAKETEYERWIEYCQSGNECDNDALWENWEKELKKEQFLSITIPLRLTGGISIRKYSAQPDKADFEHITIHGENGNPIPVIPGSSWNGAIRSCAKNIMWELGITEINSKIEQWFGFVDTLEKKEKKAQQSMVIIKESQLEDSISLLSTRNKVNRFDASTVDGALYTENAYFGGKTSLDILVRKTEDERYKPLLGLLSLIIKEIEEGYLAIGGQTAVGRGIFEADTDNFDKKVIWSEEIDEKQCLKELALLKGGY